MQPDNVAEFWEYLCYYDKELNRSDGLLFFIRDFYSVISKKKDKWGEELCEVTMKLRDVLLNMIDNLDQLRETYSENIIDI